MKNWLLVRRYFNRQLILNKEEKETETYREIAEGSRFSGYNLWILGFSMVIACIGLNTDSVAAVIGAMLISPLMGPIVGFAFALAVNDTLLKQNAIRNWLLMSLISLLASVLFFLISPFDNNTAVLASFSRATIFDILLAFFGGMAGFLGIIKKEGTKVIAGVAVATACMPPLCTAGFGLANLDFTLFAGGLYFYLINCLFIGLATFLLTRFTGYHRNHPVEGFKRTHHLLWSVFITAMIVPGLYIAYNKWTLEKQKIVSQTAPATTEQKIKQLEDRIKLLEDKLNQAKP